LANKLLLTSSSKTVKEKLMELRRLYTKHLTSPRKKQKVRNLQLAPLWILLVVLSGVFSTSAFMSRCGEVRVSVGSDGWVVEALHCPSVTSMDIQK
jgi:hypothetical protein